MKSIVSLIDLFQTLLGGLSKKSLSEYCRLETADGPVLVAKDGSMASIIRIDGVGKIMGNAELVSMVNQMSTFLSSSFAGNNGGGRAIQVFFSRDPERSADNVREFMLGPRYVANQLHLSIDDLFEERERIFPKWIVHEDFYFVLWTRPNILPRADREEIDEACVPPPILPKMKDTQNIFLAARKLLNSHNSFVSSISQMFSTHGIAHQVLNAHNALGAVRESIYPDQRKEFFKPVLPGDNMSVIRAPKDDDDAAFLMAPRLEDQIFTQGAEQMNSRVCRIGSYYFASTDMTVGPNNLEPFNDLLVAMIDRGEYPWRCSFLIEGKPFEGIQLRKMLAAILKPVHSENKQLNDTLHALEKVKDTETFVRLRVSFATWAPIEKNGDLKLINGRLSRLQDTIRTWGYTQVSEMSGDPIDGVFSSTLGLGPVSGAPAGIAPLGDVLYMLPFLRDASPWKEGSVIFRTMDKKLFKYESGSSLQDSSLDCIIAPPGKGKSVLGNTMNMSFLLSPKATRGKGGFELPYISIVDIGQSSNGLISMIKDALPLRLKGMVESRQLIMDESNSINPFDLQLGMREPLPEHKAFLMDFISLLVTPIGGKLAEKMSELVSTMVNEIYRMFSDISDSETASPKKYEKGMYIHIEDAIAKYNIPINKYTTYYGLMDAFFKVGDIETAHMCQKYAVPLLSDLQSIDNQNIQNLYGQMKTATGTPLLTEFRTLLTVAIEQYPILRRPTQFQLGNAKIVTLDIEPATMSGGEAGDKQTSVVYALAHYMLTRDFIVKDDYVRKWPELYHNWQRVKIERIQEMPKKVIYDEFHRTKNSPRLQAGLARMGREGRKYNIHMTLISQFIQDFPSDILKAATGVWLLGFNSPDAVKEAVKIWNLSKKAEEMLSWLTGPTSAGAPFVMILQTKEGVHEHFLYNTLGPIELWAFSTTAEDTSLRKKVYDALNPVEGRKRLARKFPGGTAKHEIERRSQELMNQRGMRKDDALDGVTSQIAEEIIRGIGIS